MHSQPPTAPGQRSASDMQKVGVHQRKMLGPQTNGGSIRTRSTHMSGACPIILTNIFNHPKTLFFFFYKSIPGFQNSFRIFKPHPMFFLFFFLKSSYSAYLLLIISRCTDIGHSTHKIILASICKYGWMLKQMGKKWNSVIIPPPTVLLHTDLIRPAISQITLHRGDQGTGHPAKQSILVQSLDRKSLTYCIWKKALKKDLPLLQMRLRFLLVICVPIRLLKVDFSQSGTLRKGLSSK